MECHSPNVLLEDSTYSDVRGIGHDVSWGLWFGMYKCTRKVRSLYDALFVSKFDFKQHQIWKSIFTNQG